jgi:glutaredoxin 3
MAEVTIYTSRYCPYCVQALNHLRQKKASVKEISVDGDPAVRKKMMRISGQRTVPQIWIGTEHIGGCDDMMLLSRKGVLDKLLTA